MSEETPEQRMERLSRDRYERPLPRRFYANAAATPDHGVALDSRPLKTPMKALLRLPTAGLAAAVAAEWQAQEKTINPALMPLTKLANTAIDRVSAHRAVIISELVAFAGSDLTCYRAGEPQALVARQAAAWDPVLAFAAERLGAHFTACAGVMHRPQPAAALAAVERHVESLDDFTIAAAHNLATLTGSALLALMLADGAIDAEQGWRAAHVDEDWQIEFWGEDHEAAERRAFRRAEYDSCITFINQSR